MTDDAHGLGVVGQGRGSAHAAGIKPDIQMGTFSKAVGSYGGYVAASAAVVSMLVNRARSLIFSTGLPPAVVAASTAGLDIIARDPGLCARPLPAGAAVLRTCGPRTRAVGHCARGAWGCSDGT
jgi:8-amino-7-oxononanoate synthase